MNIQKRIIGPCAELLRKLDDAKIDFSTFLHRLILFDTYIMQSTRFREIPHLVKIFWYEGFLAILKSGALKIYWLPVSPAIMGGLGTPPYKYTFRIIHIHNKNEFLLKCLEKLDRIEGISSTQLNDLKSAVISALVETPDNACIDTMKQVEYDIKNDSAILKLLVKKIIKRRFNIDIKPDDFSLRFFQDDKNDFRHETNLGNVFNLKEGIIHEIIGSSLLSLSSLNQRIEEMKTYRALSGFIDNEFPIFGEKLNFIANMLSPKTQTTRFQRVLSIKGFPDFKFGDTSIRINAEKLLEIRKSKECNEFKTWLIKIDSMTNKEIEDCISNLESKLSPIIHSTKGRVIRFLGCTGLSLILSGDPIPGIALSVIDSFLLEKILPYSSAITFINKLYPSIFEKK